MKTRAITELFKQAPFPVVLLDDDAPEWHNAAFSALDEPLRRELINWSSTQDSSSRWQRGGRRFELLIAGRHRLLIAAGDSATEASRTLLRGLLPALAAGGDPWLNTATALGPLLGWPHCAAVKHKSARADDLLGHWHDGSLRPPRHLPFDDSLAAQLYAARDDQLLVTQPADAAPTDPLFAGERPALWLAQRVESSSGESRGYLCVWGEPTPDALTRAMHLLPLAAELLTQHLALSSRADGEPAPVLAEYPSDDLTGLPGRAAFDVTLEAFERHYAQHGQDCEMAMLDINGLSAINQSRGVAFGDTVLRRFAEQLSHIGRPDDRIFRFGGDEFVVLMPFGQEPPPLQHRLEEIEQRLRDTCGIDSFSVAAGFACLSETNGSSDDLMLLSDRRLRQAKSGRGNADRSEV